MKLRHFSLVASAILSLNAYGESTITINQKNIRLNEKPVEPYLNLEPSFELYMNDAPPIADIKELQTPVKDQGSRGSCAYFTSIALVEHAAKVYFNQERELNLSEEYLIYANKALDKVSSGGDGSYLSYNLRTLRRHGFLLEEDMPYTHSWFEEGMPCEGFKDDSSAPAYCRSHFAPGEKALQNQVKPDQFQLEITQLANFDQVVEAIGEGKAVTISVPVNQNGWRGPMVQHSQELEDQCDETPDLCGGHTVLLTGYDLDKEQFTFKNSWGSKWGNEGYGIMPFDFVKNWSYGKFYVARFKTLSDLNNTEVDVLVEDTQVEVVKGVERNGEFGILAKLSFAYKAPLGSFYYVSLFAQRRVEEEAGAAQYLPISLDTADGFSYLSDRQYRLAKTEADLSFGEGRTFDLFISYADIELAGVDLEQATDVFLRPSIYRMSDMNSYQVLYRDYLPL